MTTTVDHPPAQPHDPIVELFPDVFFVQGSIRMGPGMRINRNMVVLRQDGALTLLTPVRLSKEGETELKALGKIENVVRLGYFHGMDDRYYVDEHGAKFWCQAGSDQYAEPKPDAVMDADTELPVSDTELFVFRETKRPESAVLLGRHGGLLITCDSVQHHGTFAGCSVLARVVMLAMGFKKPANIGPPWRKFMTREGGSLRPDFERLLELDFAHLVGAHGSVLRGGARKALAATVARVFPQ